MLPIFLTQKQANFSAVIKHGPFYLKVDGNSSLIKSIKICSKNSVQKKSVGAKPLWLAKLKKCLDHHHQGKNIKPHQLPLDFTSLTDFQRHIVLHLNLIPYGQTWSYQKLAIKTGRKKAIRAVASAVAKNPFPLLFPCHRVCLSDGSIGHFSAGGGSKTKQMLLDYEQHCLELKR